MLDRISLLLSIIGGINWLLVGLFRFDLVAYLFGGQAATASRVIYTIVGVAALWCISLLFRERIGESEADGAPIAPAGRSRIFASMPAYILPYEPSIARWVASSASPVTRMPCAFWKAATALAVWSP